MERLTIRNSDGTCSQPTNLNWSEALNKLADYEDTGLTPDEIEEIKYIKWWSQSGTDDMMSTICGMPVNRLRELAVADRDSRVVMLPCKVGDTVYRTFFVPGRDPVIVEVKMNNRLDIIGFLPRFGKTVFLTRAEADAALKEQEAQP